MCSSNAQGSVRVAAYVRGGAHGLGDVPNRIRREGDLRDGGGEGASGSRELGGNQIDSEGILGSCGGSWPALVALQWIDFVDGRVNQIIRVAWHG